MQFQVSTSSWETRISAIVESFDTLESFPPLIVECRSGALIVSDGNHRLGAFTALGLAACWVILWCADETQKAHCDD